MADIDKALPNVETEIKVPGDEEVLEMEKETIEEQVGPDDIEVTQEEDGGATIILILKQLINQELMDTLTI